MNDKKHNQRFDLSPNQDNLKHYEHVGLFTKAYVHGGMNRIRLTPRWVERFLSIKIYLHQMIAPDPGGDMHDHPWKSFSVLLSGDIEEQRLVVTEPSFDSYHVLGYAERAWMPRFIYRTPDYAHRIVGGSWQWGKPAWTLFITWGRKRPWGFWVLNEKIESYHHHRRAFRFVRNDKYLKGEQKRG